jgi:hypothetical protein
VCCFFVFNWGLGGVVFVNRWDFPNVRKMMDVIVIFCVKIGWWDKKIVS